MKTIKIGILTTSNAINYGAVLQAYSLKTVLESLKKVDVEIINYSGDDNVTGRKYYLKTIRLKGFILNLIRFFNFKYKKSRRNLIRKFDDFKHNSLKINSNILTCVDQVRATLDYDILVCGSDQIWNLNLFQDETFFLPFDDSHPQIKYCSYAASITETMTDKQKIFFAKKLKHFSLVSVRESASAKMLEKIIGRTVFVCLDPVYLLTPNQWMTVIGAEESRSEEKYALIFFIGHGAFDQSYIDKLCVGIKTVAINLHPLKYVKIDEYVSEASPLKFISLIKNAEFVITDSFHATSFSIIFSKEFYVVKRGNRNSRTENIFNLFGIRDRYIFEGIENRSKLSYENIKANIETYRQQSFDYLRKVMEE